MEKKIKERVYRSFRRDTLYRYGGLELKALKAFCSAMLKKRGGGRNRCKSMGGYLTQRRDWSDAKLWFNLLVISITALGINFVELYRRGSCASYK